MTIKDFLLARIAEDEEVAKAAQGFTHLDSGLTGAGHWKVDWTGMRFPEKAVADYTAHYDPARVLADCGAKRKMIDFAEQAGMTDSTLESDGYGWEDTEGEMLKALAAVYSDHPDYQSEWSMS